ncbi:MAG TPA: MerR family transcriptional regulator [Propionibacteriaceae bacterium]|jgi:DNA-binding transcriptional MerR regulator|nr:MerR family transcriptional regulator [Propionibacteriaceae bacterium]
MSVLTISQLAKYAGVTVRTVRWYHQCGLLPEPSRDGSGYRRYDGQAVIDLVRISTLAGAGVPLARIGELLHADEAEFKAAVTELDAELATRVDELQQRRADLAQLPSAERLCVPDKVAELLDLERSIGISERTIAMERDAWILLAATYPEMLDQVFAWKQLTITDPEFQKLLVTMDEAFDWSPEDPRLPELARRCLEVMAQLYPPDAAAKYLASWSVDPSRYRLISDHGMEDSPAWDRLNVLVEELSRQHGYPTW